MRTPTDTVNAVLDVVMMRNIEVVAERMRAEGYGRTAIRQRIKAMRKSFKQERPSMVAETLRAVMQ